MDNHPWGRIIQREFDGTFDPALGKEAMAATDPPDQPSQATTGRANQSMPVAGIDPPGLASTASHSQNEEATGLSETDDVVNGIKGSQGVNRPKQCMSNSRQQAPDFARADCGSASGSYGHGYPTAAAAQNDGAQRNGEADICQGSSFQHGGPLAQLPESAVGAGDGSAEAGLEEGAGRGSARPQCDSAALEWQDALPNAPPDAYSTDDLPNRPRSPPNPRQLHLKHAQQRQQAGQVSQQGHEDNQTTAAKQAGRITAPSSACSLKPAQPASHGPSAPQAAGPTAALDAAGNAASAAARQIRDDQVLAFDHAVSALSALSSRSGADLQGQQQQHGLQQGQPGQVSAQTVGAAGRAPAPAAASAGQLWGGAAARVMRPTEPLPPASQLDASVLDALPLAMKRELEHAYGESHPAHCGSTTQTECTRASLKLRIALLNELQDPESSARPGNVRWLRKAVQGFI